MSAISNLETSNNKELVQEKILDGCSTKLNGIGSHDVLGAKTAVHSASISSEKSKIKTHRYQTRVNNISVECPGAAAARRYSLPVGRGPAVVDGSSDSSPEAILQLTPNVEVRMVVAPKSEIVVQRNGIVNVDCVDLCASGSPAMMSAAATARERGLNINDIRELACAKLQEQLQLAQKELQLKDKEVVRLGRIRDDVSAELEELTASLFEEAHKMVREANVKQASAERLLKESNMKIDGLMAEVDALKTLVLTSTPSLPNKHLHPQLSPVKKLTMSMRPTTPSQPPTLNRQLTPMRGKSPSHNSLVNESNRTPEELNQPWQPETDLALVSRDDKEIDPDINKEFVGWRQRAEVADKNHPFMERLYCEDILPCLTFNNKELSLAILKAVEDNSICIEAVGRNNPFPIRCALLEANRSCKYRLKLGDVQQWHYISQLCRNRIAAVCDLMSYLRYIEQGIVKSGVYEIYWEVIRLRKNICLARLGYPNRNER